MTRLCVSSVDFQFYDSNNKYATKKDAHILEPSQILFSLSPHKWHILGETVPHTGWNILSIERQDYTMGTYRRPRNGDENLGSPNTFRLSSREKEERKGIALIYPSSSSYQYGKDFLLNTPGNCGFFAGGGAGGGGHCLFFFFWLFSFWYKIYSNQT